MLKNTAPGNFIFYILIYFFLLFIYLLSNSSAAPPRRVFIFTYGIDSNIDIKGFTKEEVSECVKIARENWEESGIVKFQFNKKPDVLVTHYSFGGPNDYVGFYDRPRDRILIETDPARRFNHFNWTKKSLSHCLTHEFGHYFGLGHSLEKDSIMQAKVCDIDKPSKNDIRRLKEILYR